MTRVLPRTNFHGSKLIRCLADLNVVESGESGNGFAEKLGLWIHFTDAIALSAVHNDGVAILPRANGEPEMQSAARIAAAAEFDRIQAGLIDSIVKSCAPKPEKMHRGGGSQLPVPMVELPLDIAAAYAPYRRFYQAHQRDMEVIIRPLRVNVRVVLAEVSPSLGKLAALDETFERILRDRESKLLAMVPALLKKRFEELFAAHRQTLAGTGRTDNPADWMKSGAWLARFCSDMQMLLLAEVELRLQPALGLLEALNRQDTE